MEMRDGYLIVMALVSALTKLVTIEEKPVGYAIAKTRALTQRARERIQGLAER